MNRALPLAILLMIVLAGCTAPPPEDNGEPEEPPAENEPPAPPAPANLEVRTTGTWLIPIEDLGFDPSTLTATTGANVTITLHNDDTAPAMHGWVLEGVDGASIQSVQAGESGSVTFVAPAPGEYAFYCPVGDHRDRGQEGTLTVSAA